MIKAVIFDIDGVLIDSFDGNLKFFQNILKQAGYKNKLTRTQYKKFHYRTALRTFQIVTGGNKQKVDRLMKILHSYPLSETPLKIIPDSVSIIRKLFKKYKLALVTSRVIGGVDQYLDQSKTRRYFKTIIHFGHYKNPKPHPEPLLTACKRLKIKPNEAVYVGDAPVDIQAAKAAGMKVILYPKTKLPGADAYAKKFSDIPKIIELINSEVQVVVL